MEKQVELSKPTVIQGERSYRRFCSMLSTEKEIEEFKNKYYKTDWSLPEEVLVKTWELE